MKEPLLQSRSVHYLGLIGLLFFMGLGGVITLSCTTISVPSGGLVADQEGVRPHEEAGIAFDTGNAAKGYADYQLSPTVSISPPGKKEIMIACTWKAVKILDAFSRAELADLPPADPKDVTVTGSVARIYKDESRIRNTNYVCEFEYLGQKYLRLHTVRVSNF